MCSPAKGSSLLRSAKIQNNEEQTKSSLIELMMLKMSSVLASVGAGCDVRLSNVNINQQLHSGSRVNDKNHCMSDKCKKRVINTYHGSTRHIRPFLTKSNFQSTDEKVTPTHSLPTQHFVQSTVSSTSGISLTGPSSSLGTQLTTPSSFTRLHSVSCGESPETKSSIRECFSPHNFKSESNDDNKCSAVLEGILTSQLKPETNYGFEVCEEGKTYVLKDPTFHAQQKTQFQLIKLDKLPKNSKNVPPLADIKQNDHLTMLDNAGFYHKDKKYTVVRSPNYQYLSSPEYVNIPHKVPSSSFSQQKQNSINSYKSSIKSYIRKASPEADDIGDSSEGDSSSYLSAISYQSRFEVNSETMFQHRYDDDYSFANAKKFSKPFNHCNQL